MGLFGGNNPGMKTWGDVSAPDPGGWLGSFAQRTYHQREKNPIPFWVGNSNQVFLNQNCGTLPAGQLHPTPLPNQTNPNTFIMANARRYTPNGFVVAGGSGGPMGSGPQNAQGSAQAMAPIASMPQMGFSPWGSA